MEESRNAMIDDDLDSQALFDCWNRHLYCGVFGLPRPFVPKDQSLYNLGFCKCIICDVYWKLEDAPAFMCPCCNTKVRTKRR